MKNNRKTYLGIIALLLIISTLAFRPVPLVTEKDARSVEGIVTEVNTNDSRDLILRLNNSEKSFYINRFMNDEKNLSSIRQRLIGRQVELKYPSYWTPLDPTGSMRHVSKLSTAEEIIFNELR